jgi:hypothetical protein
MSFGNYILTLVLIVFMSIFFATAAIINQAVIKLTSEPNSLPGITYKHASAYVTMGIVFGIIAAIIVVLIAIFAFLTKAGNCCNKTGAGASAKTPTSVIVSLVVGFVIFAVFSSLFIGNSIFLAKMKSIINADPASIAVSPNTVQVFYIINAILAAVSTTLTFLALTALILAIIPQTQRFIFAIFGVKPSAALAKLSKAKTSPTASTRVNVQESIEMTAVPTKSTTTTTTKTASIPSTSSLTSLAENTASQLLTQFTGTNTISTPLGTFNLFS